jgi:hypothetical protein
MPRFAEGQVGPTHRLLAALVALGCAMTPAELYENGHRLSTTHSMEVDAAVAWIKRFEQLGCGDSVPPTRKLVEVVQYSPTTTWVMIVHGPAEQPSLYAARIYAISPGNLDAYYRSEGEKGRVRAAIRGVEAGGPRCD